VYRFVDFSNIVGYLASVGVQLSFSLPSSPPLGLRPAAHKLIFGFYRLEDISERCVSHAPRRGILQQLTRERNQLTDQKVVIKNQLHAERAEAKPNKKSIERCNKRLVLIDKQVKEILQEIKDLIETDEEVKKIVLLICSITGIGMLTAATVLGETNGFELIRNKRQLTSYAGLDVKEKQSGTSIKGKPCISKKGNKHLRKAVHLPSLSAIRYDERFKAIFVRIVAKHGIKMKAVVAVQRKLLEMIYTIYKTEKKYDKNYFKNQQEHLEIEGELVV